MRTHLSTVLPEVLAKSVDRERRAHKIGQSEHQQLEVAEVLHPLEAGELFSNEEIPVLP
jgi:hypothetical protein